MEQSKKVKEIFGMNLKRIRKERHMTQQQMSIELNIKREYLSKLERGMVNSSVKLVYRASDILHVSIQDLLSDQIGCKRTEAANDLKNWGEETKNRTEHFNHIKDWRKYRQLTKAYLSGKAGINRGYLADLEKGKIHATLECMEKLAYALNCYVWELL